MSGTSIPAREIAPAKLNLALHVRGRRDDGRHDIDTLFVFCLDGDRLAAVAADSLSLSVEGPFADQLQDTDDNLVLRAARALQDASGCGRGAAITLDKQLPVASGIGGGSADAAAALRLLTALWSIDPKHASDVAPRLGSDVPACLISLPMRGEGAGDRLTPVDLTDLRGSPVLLINPRIPLSTGEVFGRWSGEGSGPLAGWRGGHNDLQDVAIAMVPQVETVLTWLAVQPGADFVRMSGSGPTCFALFETDEARDAAADRVPREWWRLATSLR